MAARPDVTESKMTESSKQQMHRPQAGAEIAESNSVTLPTNCTLAQLQYVDVFIKLADKNIPIKAFIDSGAEICVAHKRVLSNVSYDVSGKIRL